jgi:hypothetical protein
MSRAVFAITAAAALALLAFSAPPSRAHDIDAPWCLEYNGAFDGVTECSFYSLKQCLETRLGVGGFCTQNVRRAFGAPRGSRRHRDLGYGIWPPAGR